MLAVRNISLYIFTMILFFIFQNYFEFEKDKTTKYFDTINRLTVRLENLFTKLEIWKIVLWMDIVIETEITWKCIFLSVKMTCNKFLLKCKKIIIEREAYLGTFLKLLRFFSIFNTLKYLIFMQIYKYLDLDNIYYKWQLIKEFSISFIVSP